MRWVLSDQTQQPNMFTIKAVVMEIIMILAKKDIYSKNAHFSFKMNTIHFNNISCESRKNTVSVSTQILPSVNWVFQGSIRHKNRLVAVICLGSWSLSNADSFMSKASVDSTLSANLLKSFTWDFLLLPVVTSPVIAVLWSDGGQFRSIRLLGKPLWTKGCHFSRTLYAQSFSVVGSRGVWLYWAAPTCQCVWHWSRVILENSTHAQLTFLA